MNEWLVMLTLLFGALSAFFALVVSVLGAIRSKANSQAIQRLEIHLDGRLSELLETSKTLAKVEGVNEQRIIGEAKTAAVAEGLLAAGVATALLKLPQNGEPQTEKETPK